MLPDGKCCICYAETVEKIIDCGLGFITNYVIIGAPAYFVMPGA